MQNIIDKIYEYIAEYGLKVVGAILIFIVGRWIAKLLSNLVEKAADYRDVYFDVTAKVKLSLDQNGISIPYPQRDVHMIPSNA